MTSKSVVSRTGIVHAVAWATADDLWVTRCNRCIPGRGVADEVTCRYCLERQRADRDRKELLARQRIPVPQLVRPRGTDTGGSKATTR